MPNKSEPLHKSVSVLLITVKTSLIQNEFSLLQTILKQELSLIKGKKPYFYLALNSNIISEMERIYCINTYYLQVYVNG